MNDVMIDLETLGLKPGCVILSIGAVFFGSEGLGAEFHAVLSVSEQMQRGAIVDPSTVAWWDKQSAEARTTLTEARTCQDSVLTTLNAFNTWWRDNGGKRPWANSARFDLGLLENLYDRFGIPLPWHFTQEMCYRTVKNLQPAVKMSRVGTYHNALDDAKSQAEHATRLLWPEPLEEREAPPTRNKVLTPDDDAAVAPKRRRAGIPVAENTVVPTEAESRYRRIKGYTK